MTFDLPSLKDVVHPDEWQLRQDLAACYRLVALYGWSDLVFTHISAKLPNSVTGGEHQFLINPYGLMFDEITASSLVSAMQASNCASLITIEPSGRSQPTVSHHLKVLRDAGLVTSEKRGTWAWYRVVPARVDGLRAALKS